MTGIILTVVTATWAITDIYLVVTDNDKALSVHLSFAAWCLSNAIFWSVR